MFTRNRTFSAIILIAVALSLPVIASANDNTDIRVLIDVSGSMKQNDPNNLRKPALRLLTGLLPANSKAGVWTFGQFVNMLIPHGRVDKHWKEQARRASADVNSFGLFTNIEDTLRDASWDWNKPVPGQHRSLILLTDGLVDISTDTAVNQASRQRILNDILPRLQHAEINIHTIALSSDADETLLRQLSRATQGSFTQVTTADELERLFLRIFETSTQAEALPLQNNTVQVDDSIREMTLLVFRQADTAATRIILPDGSSIDQQHTANNISWHHEQHYDLITIQKPSIGNWTIDAAMDPDNRALVVTDLSLTVDRLPSNIIQDDRRSINIHLSEKDQPIINKDFLHFIKVTATQFDQRGNQQQQWSLLDNGLRNDARENDGIYTLLLEPPLDTGRHELVIDVDGTTFSRQQRLHFEVFKYPVITALEIPKQGPPSLYISPVSGLIDPDSMQLMVMIDDEKTSRPVPRQHDNEWQLVLDDLDINTHHTLTVNVTGKQVDRDINTRLDPLFFGTPMVTEEPPAEPAPSIPAAGHESTPEQQTVNTADDTATKIDSSSNILTVLQVLFFNALIAGIIFMLYRKFKTRLHPENPLEEIPNE